MYESMGCTGGVLLYDMNVHSARQVDWLVFLLFSPLLLGLVWSGLVWLISLQRNK